MKVIFWVFMGVILMSALSYFGLRFVQSYGQEIFPNPASEEFFSYISNSIGLAVAAVAAIATIFLAYQALNLSAQQVQLEMRSAFQADIDAFRRDLAEAEKLFENFVSAGMSLARATLIHAGSGMPDDRETEQTWRYSLLPAQARDDWEKKHLEILKTHIEAVWVAYKQQENEKGEDLSEIPGEETPVDIAIEDLEIDAKNIATKFALDQATLEQVIQYLEKVARHEARRTTWTSARGTIARLESARSEVIAATDAIVAFLSSPYLSPPMRQYIDQSIQVKTVQDLMTRIEEKAEENGVQALPVDAGFAPMDGTHTPDSLPDTAKFSSAIDKIIQFSRAPIPLLPEQWTDGTMDEQSSYRMGDQLRKDITNQVAEASKWLPKLGLSRSLMTNTEAFYFDAETKLVCVYALPEKRQGYDKPVSPSESEKKKSGHGASKALEAASRARPKPENPDFLLVCAFLSTLLRIDNPRASLEEYLNSQTVEAAAAKRFAATLPASHSADQLNVTC
ncbi:hypothetical protein [Celeribacter halophilus]|uniref:Uncharacterized protein n=1 Tax=Celeribacter halophilus TaxID=576117 RepID=A0A1I3X0U3_9RHOB|nr:hypothetical protein [Celeribacter halophilus]PZX09883.1 hypothetical protein LX82_02697 [Celeribacter halophilus]SFK13402.1 hypothetical protein SAMN04488138_13611 [Celeribacter halophilus]